MCSSLWILLLVLSSTVSSIRGSDATAGPSDAYAGRIFVDALTGSDTNTGLNRQAALASIRKAIALAQPGATMIVGPGTYHEAVVMKEGVNLLGSGPETTILDACNTNSVVRGASHCRIEGFTITGYAHEDIDGVYCEDVNDFIVSHNVIKDNTWSGIGALNSSIVVCNNVIYNNRVAGLFATGDAPKASLIRNNTFSANRNEADITLWRGARAVVINNILDDIDFSEENANDAATPLYNDILVLAQPVTGFNISVSPLFVDPEKGDYHLKSRAGRWDPATQTWIKDDVTSPCIDAGDPSSLIGQESFPNGGRVNMGAYGGTTEASKSYFGEPTCEVIVAGDINGDCRVDFIDMQIMAIHWLEDHRPVD
jgi:hypothetical protein